MKIENHTTALDELNDAYSTLEDVLGDYDEIADAMEKINAVIEFLYEQEQKERT